MDKNQNEKKDYIEKHDEWQKNQFDPGYFTGGRIPIWIKKPGNKKKLGLFFFIIGLFYGGVTILNIIKAIKIDQPTEQILSAIFLGFITIVFLWAGIKLFRKKKGS